MQLIVQNKEEKKYFVHHPLIYLTVLKNKSYGLNQLEGIIFK
jgi:hypothetical protein